MFDPNWIVAGALIIQTICAIVALFRDGERARAGQTRWPMAFVILMTLVTWGAVGFDFYDRHFAVPPSAVVQGYGHQPPATFFMNVDGKGIYSLRTDYKVMLIVRTIFADIDRMTDERIEKSGAYSILDGAYTLAVVTSGKMRLAAMQANTVEYDLILIPAKISPDRIANLQDVERLGGRILASAGQTVFGGPPETAPVGQPK